MKNSIKAKLQKFHVKCRHRVNDPAYILNLPNTCTITEGKYAGHKGYITDTDEGMACLISDKRYRGKIIDVVLLPPEMDLQIRQGFTEIGKDEE